MLVWKYIITYTLRIKNKFGVGVMGWVRVRVLVRFGYMCSHSYAYGILDMKP